MRRAGDAARGDAHVPEPDGTHRSGENGLSALRNGLRELFAAPATPIGRERAPGPPRRSADPAGLAEPTGIADPAGRAGDGIGPPTAIAAPGPEELRKRRISGRRRWYAGSLVGLAFLVVAMVQAATNGGSVASVVAFELLAVAFGVFYVFAPVRVSGGFTEVGVGSWGKLAALAAMVAITVPMIIIGGTGVAALWIYVGVAAAIMFPLGGAMVIALVLAAAMLAIAGLAGDSLPWELALTLVALSLWMAGFAGNIRLTIELRETRDELARAAVAAERARIGRDLHDILGHSLTAIAVKAGLARRLIDRDTPAAATEITDVQRLAREALADVRATAAGYRDVSLAGELAVARSVLTAAGIQPDLPTAVDDVSPAGRDLFGYVVREAVTNIVRHSDARRCSVELTRASVQITDDGRGTGRRALDIAGATGAADATSTARSGDSRPGRDPVRGGGLRGLAERVSAAGGTLVAGPLDGGGFRVLATLPVPHPLEPDRTSPAGRDAPAPAAPVTATPSTPGPAR